MRWLALLFIPFIASATDLTGVWSATPQGDQAGIHRVVIVDASDRIYFDYENHGRHLCEVFGIANKASRRRYVFKNDKQHHFYEGYEGYGFEENQDCEVSFELEGTTLKVRATGNCNSFCGVNASIGGDLRKVPDENLRIAASGQPEAKNHVQLAPRRISQ